MRNTTAGKLGLITIMAAFPLLGIVIPGSVTGVGQDTNPLDYYSSTLNGVNLSGVVFISGSSYSCSGALISATQILTAAHCYDGSTTSVNFVTSVNGNGTDNFTTIDATASSWILDPSYQPDIGGDLAIINLPTAAPASATVYSLYSGVYTSNSAITVAGFGYTGTGDTGEAGGLGERRVGDSAYETTGGALGMASDLLIANFNNGVAANDSLGGPTFANEVDIAHGDSGGPSFYDGEIIGIHDIIGCMSRTSGGGCSNPPSVAPINNSSEPDSYYGEYFGDTSVEADAAFINEYMATPEPATWLLFCSAISLIAIFRRRSGQSLR